MKRLKKILCTVISLILALSFALQFPAMNSYAEVTNDVIKAKEEELAAAQKEEHSEQYYQC